jgi:hypothetical protein
MRPDTSELAHASPTDNFVRVLDQFASLSSYASEASTIGGYRVLSSRRTAPRKKHRSASTATAAPARSAARVRWTGSLSVLFIGGLGLAVLAGPANCPCSSAFAVAEQSSLARLGYVQNARMMVEREMVQPDAELPALSTAALIEPEESAVGLSSITTSALEPSREATAIASEVLSAPRAPRLPANIEQLADAGPENVKLAAASDITTDVPPTLPIIEVATPPDDSVEPAPAPRRKSVDKARNAKKRALRAYRTGNEVTLRAKAKTPVGDPTKQAPKWAQQMFVNPWQSRAFSYTQ